MEKEVFCMGDIGQTVKELFQNIYSQIFAGIVNQWYWPILFIGIMVLAVATIFVLIHNSYESRLSKAIRKLNAYFLKNPYITDDNLIEFNNMMKDVPRILRNNWQSFMLNREEGPSFYMNVKNCVDKPLKSSSIERHIGNFTIFTIIIAIVAFLCGLTYASMGWVANPPVGEILFYALLVPAIMFLIYTIFYLIFRAVKNDIYSSLYENFPVFERNMEKATTKLPGYVDYEILFTKKEIKDGIPILQQYLEKRAIIEQQEIENARQNALISEEYDFSELGIDGSLVLERAMKESESFIKARRRLEDESNSIEGEKENYKKTFEANSKDMQRKLQASRENMESLKKQQEESTNRIETNYIRKQLADEMKKQQQLEKDLEEATAKFNEEQESLQKEIDKRNGEIDEKRAFVEQAMMLEFKHYANTLFKVLTEKATEVSNQKIIALNEQNEDLRKLITDLEGGVNDNSYDTSQNLVQPEELATGDIYDTNGVTYEDISQNYEEESENKENVEEQSDEETFFGNEESVEESLPVDAEEEESQEIVEESEVATKKVKEKTSPKKSKKVAIVEDDAEEKTSNDFEEVEEEKPRKKSQPVSQRRPRKSNASPVPKEPKKRAKSRKIDKTPKPKKSNRKLKGDSIELDDINKEMDNLLRKAKRK